MLNVSNLFLYLFNNFEQDKNIYLFIFLKSIGFNAEDKDHLDTFLLNNYLKNTPANFSVLSPNMFIDRNLVCKYL